MYLAMSNVYVHLILWLFLYVIFRTVYVLDKFCIQWLYYQQWILELSINVIQCNSYEENAKHKILTHLTPCMLPNVSWNYCECMQSSDTKKLEVWTLLLLCLFLVCDSTWPVMFERCLTVMLLVYNIGYWYCCFTQG